MYVHGLWLVSTATNLDILINYNWMYKFLNIALSNKGEWTQAVGVASSDAFIRLLGLS